MRNEQHENKLSTRGTTCTICVCRHHFATASVDDFNALRGHTQHALTPLPTIVAVLAIPCASSAGGRGVSSAGSSARGVDCLVPILGVLG